MNKHLISKLMLAVTLLFMGFGTSTAHAADGHLVFNTAAFHFKNFEDRNAFVPGLGWEYSPTGKIGFHVGTLSDSFGAQASYFGFNYGTRRMLNNRIRFLVGATAVHKQFHKNKPLETKIVPFPVMEINFSKRASLNITGSPEIDYAGSHSNAVMFFQFKLQLQSAPLTLQAKQKLPATFLALKTSDSQPPALALQCCPLIRALSAQIYPFHRFQTPTIKMVTEDKHLQALAHCCPLLPPIVRLH